MAGDARFTPSEEDAAEASRDGFRRFLGQPAQRSSLLWLGAAFVLIGLALAVGRQRFDWLLWPCLYGLVAVSLLLAAVVLGQAATLGRKARRLFRQDRGVHTEHRYAWTDEGLSFDSGAGQGRIGWGDLYRWSEGRSNFLFWTTEQTYLYLPRRSLDAALAEDLRGTLVRFGPLRY